MSEQLALCLAFGAFVYLALVIFIDPWDDNK
jgi:hypothetical protein